MRRYSQFYMMMICAIHWQFIEMPISRPFSLIGASFHIFSRKATLQFLVSAKGKLKLKYFILICTFVLFVILPLWSYHQYIPVIDIYSKKNLWLSFSASNLVQNDSATIQNIFIIFSIFDKSPNVVVFAATVDNIWLHLDRTFWFSVWCVISSNYNLKLYKFDSLLCWSCFKPCQLPAPISKSLCNISNILKAGFREISNGGDNPL